MKSDYVDRGGDFIELIADLIRKSGHDVSRYRFAIELHTPAITMTTITANTAGP